MQIILFVYLLKSMDDECYSLSFQKLLNLSFVKDEDTYGEKNGQKRSYNSRLLVTFISKQSLDVNISPMFIKKAKADL